MLTNSCGGQLEGCSFLHAEFAWNWGENLKTLQQSIIVLLLIECLRERERDIYIYRKKEGKTKRKRKREREREREREKALMYLFRSHSAVGGCLAWPCFRPPKDDRASTATTKAGALDQCSSVLNPCNRRFILYTSIYYIPYTIYHMPYTIYYILYTIYWYTIY